jgi:hypothetical protein
LLFAIVPKTLFAIVPIALLVEKLVRLLTRKDVDRAGWAGDFDWYRANYEKLTFDDIKRLNVIWSHKYPVQKHCNLDFVIKCFRRIISETGRDQLRVAELGGYNGELALDVFRVFPRLDWLNIEIIAHNPVNDLKNYQYAEYVLSAQIWEEGLDLRDRDVFVSVNTLEHFPDNEMREIVEYLSKNRPRYLVLSVPTVFGGLNWNGYFGSHLLEMGKDRVKALLSESYVILMEESQAISYFFHLISSLRRGILSPVLERLFSVFWSVPISRKWNTL